MKKKLLIVLLAGLSVGLGASHAQTAAVPASTPSHSFTVTGATVSQYMFRGQRLGGWSFQPSAEYAAGNLGLGLWGNVPLRNPVPDTSDPEIDFYGYYTATVNDAVSIVPGFTWYYFPKAPTALGFYRSTFEPSLALNYTVGGLKLTPKVYYDFVLEGPTYELGAFYALPLTAMGTELDFSATVGTYRLSEAVRDANPRTEARGDYWSAGVALPFQVAPDIKITLGWTYAKGTSASFSTGGVRTPNPLAVGRGVASLSLSHTF